MALPSDITTCTLTFGPYLDSHGDPTFVGLSAHVEASTRLLHVPTGAVLVDTARTLTLGADGAATLVLPHTDNPALSPVGYTYTVRWVIRAGQADPGSRRIALPTAAGTTVDYDLLVPSPADPGVVVPLAVGPRGPLGPTGPAGPTGQPGPVGPPGDAAYVFTQDTAAASWHLVHPLGRLPAVALYSASHVSGSLVLVEADVEASTSAVSITFPMPTAGYAVLT